ncbi:MAG: hypothetical protein HKN26_10445 [Acidimicrobiales bacterium]|nr:hypothetical protein [Acidimicrobiales bacterium]
MEPPHPTATGNLPNVQMVFLTARPALFAETLAHVRHGLPFIEEVVAICPERTRDAVAAIDDPALVVLTDEAITDAGDAGSVAGLDHTSRNYRLRTTMLEHDAIASQFVMADDDNRPLRVLGPDIFVDDRGRYRNYWFYELSRWRRTLTPMDQGLTNAMLVLQRHGIREPLAYASHMPQIMDRDLFREVAATVADAGATYPLDEWSIYFNLARHLHPDRFAPPERFVTLAWPQFPNEWQHQVAPAAYEFENHYPELYESGALFDGLPTELRPERADADNLEKQRRWHELDIAVRNLEIPDSVTNPWTTGRPHRKLFFRGTKAMRKVVEYATLDDRAAIAGLAGRIRALEDRLDGLEPPIDRPDNS